MRSSCQPGGYILHIINCLQLHPPFPEFSLLVTFFLLCVFKLVRKYLILKNDYESTVLALFEAASAPWADIDRYLDKGQWTFGDLPTID